MIVMDAKNQLKFDVIVKVCNGKISISDAARLLNKSKRTIERYQVSYKKDGILFVSHKNKNRTPVNKTPDKIKTKIQKLIKEKYPDFNLTHLREKLIENEGIDIQRETLRKLAHDINQVKRKKRRRKIIRKRRERMSSPGLLLQMDGSHHLWFGKEKSCLLAIIDDSNSEVHARFFPSETTDACMALLKDVIISRGVFKVLYVDRAGIFAGPKRCDFSQVLRACEELGIEVIYANSPEAKGRIERSFDTFQDRLIPELRLKGIDDMEEANRYLKREFIPNYWNRNIMVEPEIKKTEYKKLKRGINLNDILIQKDHRIVNKDHTFSYRGKRYLIDSFLDYSIVKKEIEIRVHSQDNFKVFFANKELKASLVRYPHKISSSLNGIQKNIEAVRLAESLNNISKASRETGVSRQTIYEYKKLLRFHSKEELLKKSKGRQRSSHLSGKVEDALLAFSLGNPFLGGNKIAAYIREKYKIDISPASVRNIWVRHDMQTTKLRIEKREKINSIKAKAA